MRECCCWWWCLALLEADADEDDVEDDGLEDDGLEDADLDVATFLDVVDEELAEDNSEWLAGPRLLDGVRELDRSWESVWPVLRAKNLLQCKHFEF